MSKGPNRKPASFGKPRIGQEGTIAAGAVLAGPLARADVVYETRERFAALLGG